MNLADSLLAQGLSGCRLAANFEGDCTEPGINIQVTRERNDAFPCLPCDSTPPNLVDFGEADLPAGRRASPALVPLDVVTELHQPTSRNDSADGLSRERFAHRRIGGAQVPIPSGAEVTRQLRADRVGRAVAPAARRFARSRPRPRLAQASWQEDSSSRR